MNRAETLKWCKVRTTMMSTQSTGVMLDFKEVREVYNNHPNWIIWIIWAGPFKDFCGLLKFGRSSTLVRHFWKNGAYGREDMLASSLVWWSDPFFFRPCPLNTMSPPPLHMFINGIFGMLQHNHRIRHEGDCVLDLWRSLYSLPWVCLPVILLPPASLHVSDDMRAKYYVSFTRPTNRAPPPSMRQGHTTANRASLWVYFLPHKALSGCRLRSAKHNLGLSSFASRNFFTSSTSLWSSALAIRHFGM